LIATIQVVDVEVAEVVSEAAEAAAEVRTLFIRY
jgi:hypothetical protein